MNTQLNLSPSTHQHCLIIRRSSLSCLFMCHTATSASDEFFTAGRSWMSTAFNKTFYSLNLSLIHRLMLTTFWVLRWFSALTHRQTCSNEIFHHLSTCAFTMVWQRLSWYEAKYTTSGGENAWCCWSRPVEETARPPALVLSDQICFLPVISCCRLQTW